MVDWVDFRSEAFETAVRETLLAPFINDTILVHSSFEESISALLSTSFAGILPLATWREIFQTAFSLRDRECLRCNGIHTSGSLTSVGSTDSSGIDSPPAEEAMPPLPCCKYDGINMSDVVAADLKAIKTRDPACTSIVNAYLYFKGFKALQAHRAAHILWYKGRNDVALAIQSRAAELWSVDIHPAAHIGPGLMIDHGTGVVIGETAVVGRDCSFLHGVTLGSTGKDTGDRHPKVGDGVLIGCNAQVLGNITIGSRSKIGSGSVVIKSIPAGATAVGNPARIIGKTSESDNTSPAAEMDLALKSVIMPCGNLFRATWQMWADGSISFDDVDAEGKGYVTKEDFHRVLVYKYRRPVSESCMEVLFNKLDYTREGKLSRSRFNSILSVIRPIIQSAKQPLQSHTGLEEARVVDENIRQSVQRGEDQIDHILTDFFTSVTLNILQNPPADDGSDFNI